MKLLKNPFCVFLILLFSVFTILQCNKPNQPLQDDLVEVKNVVFKNNELFLAQIHELIILISKDSDNKIVQKKFDSLRQTYKKMEWAIEYFLPHSARFINGPALPEIEMAEHVEIEPEGLQVLEEMLYSEEKQDKAEVIRILKKLINKGNTIKTNFQVITVTKDQTFDALRQEIFRISSLGIAGFDTPISGKFLEEMSVSLESFTPILNLISTEKSQNSSLKKIVSEINQSKRFLNKNKDKNTFNYLEFLSVHLNNLSYLLLDFRREENIPHVEVTTALRKNAAQFYSKDAFDVNAFTPGKQYETSPEKVQLGKQLFNDKILSNNNSRSCATCHNAEKAFTDGLEKSMSLDNTKLQRNTPSLSYSAFQHGQFWDMRKDDLEGQSSDVITNKEEMHGDLQTIILKINQNKNYKTDFKKIFKTEKAEVWQLQNLLASYIRSLATFTSDFDEYMRGNRKALTNKQKRGFNLFMGKAQCATCHFLPLFNGTVPPNFKKTEQEVLGVAENAFNKKIDSDAGRGKFHQTVAFLQNSFKTPTLRNVSKTAPYMHNGGYKTLQEVMQFYNQGGGKGFNLKVENQTLSDKKLNLTSIEIDEIIEFLNALNDK